jgi:arylsulfatase A
VRSGSWKLIENYEDGSLELYNLDEDIGETRNLTAGESQRVQTLHKKLVEWRKSVDANMPPPNPKYHPKSP